VKELFVMDAKKYDFSKDLKWNTNLIHIEYQNQVPLYYYYLRRNQELASIQKRFPNLIFQVKTFEISFQFK
jgi:hypothetical protein